MQNISKTFWREKRGPLLLVMGIILVFLGISLSTYLYDLAQKSFMKYDYWEIELFPGESVERGGYIKNDFTPNSVIVVDYIPVGPPYRITIFDSEQIPVFESIKTDGFIEIESILEPGFYTIKVENISNTPFSVWDIGYQPNLVTIYGEPTMMTDYLDVGIIVYVVGFGFLFTGVFVLFWDRRNRNKI